MVQPRVSTSIISWVSEFEEVDDADDEVSLELELVARDDVEDDEEDDEEACAPTCSLNFI